MSEETIDIDFDDLTLGEAEEVEEIIGKPLSEAITQRIVRDENDEPELRTIVDAKTIAALVWISKRRENPDYTLDDARKIKMAAIADESEDEVPPTDAAG